MTENVNLCCPIILAVVLTEAQADGDERLAALAQAELRRLAVGDLVLDFLDGFSDDLKKFADFTEKTKNS